MLYFWLAALMDSVAQQAIANAPEKSGRLKGSIGSRVEGSGVELVGVAYADAPYAAPVHEGAVAHPIVARNARALRFPDKGGQIIFRRRVNHPGNQPNRFLLNALISVVTAATAGGANG